MFLVLWNQIKFDSNQLMHPSLEGFILNETKLQNYATIKKEKGNLT